MSGILLAFFGALAGGGPTPPIGVVSDGSFSGAPLAETSFGG
jgi:hypothetical protein